MAPITDLNRSDARNTFEQLSEATGIDFVEFAMATDSSEMIDGLYATLACIHSDADDIQEESWLWVAAFIMLRRYGVNTPTMLTEDQIESLRTAVDDFIATGRIVLAVEEE